MDVVFGHADRVLVLVRGEIIAGGTPDEVRADPRVQAGLSRRRARPGGAGPMTAAASRGRAASPPPTAGPQVLFGLSSQLARRRGRGPGRPQRRRQVDDPQGHHGPRLPARRERLAFKGRARSACRPTASPGSGLGYVPEDRRIFTDLTVDENLEVGRAGRPRRAARPGPRSGSFPALPQPRRDARPARRRRCPAASSRCSPSPAPSWAIPDAILLDEPSEGLAPVIVQMMARGHPRHEGRGRRGPALRAELGLCRRRSATAPA